MIVASITATSVGTIRASKLRVSSSTSTSPDSGPCMAAARNAPPPMIARPPSRGPPQIWVHTVPSTPASRTPTVSVGVNRPPGEPDPRQAAVASGLRTSSTHSRPSDREPSASSWTTPLPLPSSWGYWIETSASAVKVTSGAAQRPRPCGLRRLATAIRRTQPIATTPITGPASAAHASCEALTAYAGR
jgi:hypothetical protein